MIPLNCLILLFIYGTLTGPDPDDELDAGYTDAEGKFQLKGDTRELTTIGRSINQLYCIWCELLADPQLKIYHDCYDDKPCQRKWVLNIPDKYITSGPTPKTLMNLGVVNLEVEIDGESRDCVH